MLAFTANFQRSRRGTPVFGLARTSGAMKHLARESWDHVVILSGDQLYRMGFSCEMVSWSCPNRVSYRTAR
jgi:hypothetical protein